MNKIFIFAILAFFALGQYSSPSRPVTTYDYRMTIESEQLRSIDDSRDSMSVTVQAIAKIAAQFQDSTESFKAYISYENLEISKFDVQSQLQVNSQESSQQDFTAFYIAIIDYITGKVIEVQQPVGQDDKLMQWVTVDLIKQTFPDLRYQLSGNKFSKLQQEQIIDDDHLGTVTPHFSSETLGDQIIAKKFYTDDDFQDLKYDLGNDGPQINYEQTHVIDKKSGQIKRSHQIYTIDLANEIDYQLSQSDAEPVEEILGEIHASVESDLQTIKVSNDPQTLYDIMDLVTNTKFKKIDLTNDGGKVEMFDERKSKDQIQQWDVGDKLSQGNPIYTKTYDIFKKTLLGQTFGIEARYINYGQSSNVSAHVVLNDRSLLKLLEFSYEHCPKSRSQDYNKEYNLQLFSINYPVLAVLSIHVTASLQIKYGYTWYYGGNDANTGCEIRFQPYVQPGLQATGAANVLGVAEGGMYASGTVANSYLTFKAELKNAFTAQSQRLGGSVSLYVKINPFEYDIGAYYKLIKCDLKKLFRWPPKFTKICSMGDAHKISLINGKIGNGYDHTIFQWSFQI